MKPRTIAVDCACGHSHEIDRPDNEYALGRACDKWADMLCLNCELNGNEDVSYCKTHKIWFKSDQTCWQCDYEKRSGLQTIRRKK